MPSKLNPANTNRETALLVRYGISLEAYGVLEQAQNYCCKICGKHKSEVRLGILDVDHDHKTGEIRGLLCSSCNRGIGFFLENTTNLLRAIQYLKRKL